MPSYSGVWTLTAQYQAKGSGNWPFPPPLLTGSVAVFAGQQANKLVSTSEYINISSLSNSANFGDLLNPWGNWGTCASTTRGLFSGEVFSSNVIQYITIATAGNAIDFGDLTRGREYHSGGCNSTTRGVFAPSQGSNNESNVIDYVTIATTGNATDFGDTTILAYETSSASSQTRGIIAVELVPTAIIPLV